MLAEAAGQTVSRPPIDYVALLPLFIVVGVACVGVLLEAFVPRRARWTVQVPLTLAALIAALVSLGVYASSAPRGGITTIAKMVSVDRPALFLWGTLLVLGIGATLLIADKTVERGGYFVTEPRRRHEAATGRLRVDQGTGPGAATAELSPAAASGSAAAPSEAAQGMRTEVFPLTLFSLSGMMAFVAANNLLAMFIALEVLSLPLYLLCGLARRRRLLSQEAAIKYFLLGAFSSAFFLYGVALLYGYAGSVQLSAISHAAAGNLHSDALLFVGMGLLAVGLLFKGSVGPFHTWTPDVYQGAPTPITAFMGSATKVAAFGGMLRVFMLAFGSTHWEWRGVLWAVAIASMVIGTILGITQSDMTRMIAYSSIAHAGFLLIGVISISEDGISSTLFYLLAYAFTTLAVFGVITLVRDSSGEAGAISAWTGLAKRSPLVAWVFTFLLLSLAGVPLTSGFIGKFVVFGAGIASGQLALVIVALLASAVTAFFYLRVVLLMFLAPPAPDGATVSVPGAFTTAAITLGVAVTLVLGIWPNLVLGWAAGGGFAI
jgi:NADH-quinone oxidoreductase subunit N